MLYVLGWREWLKNYTFYCLARKMTKPTGNGSTPFDGSENTNLHLNGETFFRSSDELERRRNRDTSELFSVKVAFAYSRKNENNENPVSPSVRINKHYNITTGEKKAALTTATQFFFTNFNNGVPAQFSGITTTENVGGYNGIGTGTDVFSGNFLRNKTGGVDLSPGTITPGKTTLTLTNLPTHNSINLSFLLAIIDSWDGNFYTPFLPAAPDLFNVSVDGKVIFSQTFTNTLDPNVSNASYNPPPGVFLNRGQYIGWNDPVLGVDSAYNMGLDPTFKNIPHTASTLTVQWYAGGSGWQGGNDESWAIDNVGVTLNNVPVLPTVTLAVNATGISENSPSNFVYTFTRSGSISSPLTVNFSIGGTATFNTDYTRVGTTPFTATTGNITFATGSPTATLTLDPTADLLVESNETISLTLTSNSAYTIGTTSPVVSTIINDDNTRNQRATSGNDILLGTTRADILNGGAGADNLTGGANADTFVFSESNQGIDRINDFVPGDDTILVLSSGFTGGGLAGGNTITQNQFVIGTAASTVSNRFVYNSATGALSYDRDGTGSALPVQFATLNTGLALTSEDILVG
ncbi:MAG: hypothetical protein N5P05_004568 (plasmid) [Chroococcopsis gigantea SAG 12.99]|jgi:Ca2+-binding RTX toxin-like protein|nr:hypothetical protein [Chroococcopsis gigantea SAG 12.99]